ncbi:substrate-binding periplasmic protein [Pseudoduganella ginsengisoli]
MFRTVLLACLLTTAPAMAATCPDPLRAGISELGYSGYLEQELPRGAAADVLREAARRSGCTVELTLYPRSRLFVEFDQGHVDVAASAARSDERDRSGVFIPYAMSRFDLVLASRPARRFHSLADFVTHGTGTLNIVRGAFYTPDVLRQLERLRSLARLEEVTDFEMAFRKMAAGRAAGTLAPEMVSARLLDQFSLAATSHVIAIPESPPMEVGAYLSRNSLSVAEQDALANALRAMAQDGAILAIYRKYLGDAAARALLSGGRRR